MLDNLAVEATSSASAAKAGQIADRLGLPLVNSHQPLFRFILLVSETHLALKDNGDPKLKPFFIDFTQGKLLYRSKQAGLKKELLARAIGIKPLEKPAIVDATAGLGRDSFILAHLGFTVTMLERSPVIHALLNDALHRLEQHQAFEDTAKRMQLILTDANEWLDSQTSKPDVIYLDPMFPARQKSASVKKEIRLLQALLPTTDEPDSLFKNALSCATRRVVVKRPRHANPIADQKPTYSLAGTTCRFDIYTV